MATDKPRFSVSFTNDSFDKIRKYQIKEKISTQSKAVANLVELALDEMERNGEIKKAPLFSREAAKLAEDYDKKLDIWGKRQVRAVADNEIARCEDETRFIQETTLEEEPKIINLYCEPAAAGIPSPVMGRDFEPYEMKDGDPKGAAYAVRIQGDSMEPYFPDGSIVFVNHDALRDGEVGIFCVDEGTVCKQYHKDGPVVYLFSLNRDRADADVILLPGGNRTCICQGRVMTRQRFPVPGRR